MKQRLCSISFFVSLTLSCSSNSTESETIALLLPMTESTDVLDGGEEGRNSAHSTDGVPCLDEPNNPASETELDVEDSKTIPFEEGDDQKPGYENFRAGWEHEHRDFPPEADTREYEATRYMIAQQHYVTAVELGNAHAHTRLGDFNLVGLGSCDPNPIRAIEWYLKAKALGDTIAGRRLAALSKDLNYMSVKCTVCLERMRSRRTNFVAYPCGHPVHLTCYTRARNNSNSTDPKCPSCNCQVFTGFAAVRAAQRAADETDALRAADEAAHDAQLSAGYRELVPDPEDEGPAVGDSDDDEEQVVSPDAQRLRNRYNEMIARAEGASDLNQILDDLDAMLAREPNAESGLGALAHRYRINRFRGQLPTVPLGELTPGALEQLRQDAEAMQATTLHPDAGEVFHNASVLAVRGFLTHLAHALPFCEVEDLASMLEQTMSRSATSSQSNLAGGGMAYRNRNNRLYATLSWFGVNIWTPGAQIDDAKFMLDTLSAFLDRHGVPNIDNDAGAPPP